MKFSHVLLLTGVICGRPNSVGVLFATDTSVSAEGEQTKTCFEQNTQIDGDWTRQCLTEDECCSKTITQTVTLNDKGERSYVFVCGCVGYNKPHHGNVSNCCSGLAQKKRRDLCDCLKPTQAPQSQQAMRTLKLEEDDCCYEGQNTLDEGDAATRGREKGFSGAEMLKCGPRPCQAPGSFKNKIGPLLVASLWDWFTGNKTVQSIKEKGICCGGQEEDFLFGAKVCKCIPFNTVTNPHLETVDSSMCCSGQYSGDTHVCGCMLGGQLLDAPGASKSDCCSGLSDGRKDGPAECLAMTCKLPFEKKENGAGDYCCTDKQGTLKAYKDHVTTSKSNVFCGCIKGGVKVAENETSFCCSGRRDKDSGKCEWLSYQQKLNIDIMTEDECFSGKAEHGKCLCMGAGSDTRGDVEDKNSGECCSNSLAGNRCGCVHARNMLREGATRQDCCTRLVQDSNPNYCACGPIGCPNDKTAGMVALWDCCSTEASGGHCSCVKPNKTVREPKYCCGSHVGKACQCLPPGSAVSQGHTAADVCCSGNGKAVENTKHDGHCDHIEECL